MNTTAGPIPPGTRVHYAGRHRDAHGEYTAAPCDCARCTRHASECPHCQAGRYEACIDPMEGGGVVYNLTPVDDQTHGPLRHASRQHLTPLT